MEKFETILLVDFFKSFDDSKKNNHKSMNMMVDKFGRDTYHDGDEFCRQGEVADTIGLVISGLFVSSTTDANGKKRVRDLNHPGQNNIVGNWNSILSGNAAVGSITSAGKSILLSISKTDFNGLCVDIPYFNGISRSMINNSRDAKIQLLMNYEGLSKEEKKQKFITDYPSVQEKLTLIEFAQYFNLSKNSYRK